MFTLTSAQIVHRQILIHLFGIKLSLRAIFQVLLQIESFLRPFSHLNRLVQSISKCFNIDFNKDHNLYSFHEYYWLSLYALCIKIFYSACFFWISSSNRDWCSGLTKNNIPMRFVASPGPLNISNKASRYDS